MEQWKATKIPKKPENNHEDFVTFGWRKTFQMENIIEGIIFKMFCLQEISKICLQSLSRIFVLFVPLKIFISIQNTNQQIIQNHFF